MFSSLSAFPPKFSLFLNAFILLFPLESELLPIRRWAIDKVGTGDTMFELL